MLSRREALRTIGLGAVAGAAAGGTTALLLQRDIHPDAALIALGAELEEAWKAEAALEASGVATDKDFDDATGFSSDIAQQISDLTARTLDGVRVKLRAFAWCRDGDLDTEHTDGQLIASLFRDLNVPNARIGRAA